MLGLPDTTRGSIFFRSAGIFLHFHPQDNPHHPSHNSSHTLSHTSPHLWENHKPVINSPHPLWPQLRINEQGGR